MNDDRAFRHDFARHAPANLDGLHLDAPEEMHVRFPIDDDVLRDQAARNLADEIDRGGADALHIPAHLAFNQGGAAGHRRAAQVALRRNVNLTLGLDRAAEARGDLVIPQVDVRAAFRTKTRRGG